jgi:hypothetical protein
MNVADERSRSCWIEDGPAIEVSPLKARRSPVWIPSSVPLPRNTFP